MWRINLEPRMRKMERTVLPFLFLIVLVFALLHATGRSSDALSSDTLSSHAPTSDALPSDALPSDALTDIGSTPGLPDSASDALELLQISINEMKRQDSLLAGYRYLKTVVVEHLNKDLSSKRSETRLFEVTSVPDGPDIEVLVAVDGDSVSEKKQQKSRSKQEKGEKNGDGQIELESEELITLFEWSADGRELVSERPATILRFRPKRGATYTGNDPKAERFLRNVRGRAWVDDKEHVISKIEFESMKPIKSFGGVLWTLHAFRVTEERRRLPGGVWIDSAGEYFIHATALVFKKIRTRSTMHTHDYVRPNSARDSTTSWSSD
jgi:hypothetical protein